MARGDIQYDGRFTMMWNDGRVLFRMALGPRRLCLDYAFHNSMAPRAPHLSGSGHVHGCYDILAPEPLRMATVMKRYFFFLVSSIRCGCVFRLDISIACVLMTRAFLAAPAASEKSTDETVGATQPPTTADCRSWLMNGRMCLVGTRT